jgi:2-hydroxychromene-2-carboxylate isomerase
MSASPALEFWYDFASTYSYLSAVRIEDMADRAGVSVRWRPFLLGPIFAAQGWSSSPFNLFPAKGRHMWRDMERQVAGSELPPLVRPDPFPQNSLLAARVGLVGAEAGWLPDFTRSLFRAEFAEGASISDPAVLSRILTALALDPEAVLAEAGREPIKSALRRETDKAQALGVFGAPSFLTPDGELFWGNDRLADAIAWTAERAG